MRFITLFLVSTALGCSSTTSVNGSDAGTGSDASAGGDSSTGGDSGGGGDSGTGGDAAMGTCNPACTGAHMTCDPLDNKCKLDGTTTNVGGTCDTSGADPKCGTAPNATCNDLTQDGFPGGYCSMEPCSVIALCPVGATCTHLGGESNACYKICSSNADCRSPDYECLNIDPLFTSGAGHKVCYLKDFACNTSADCPTVKPACTGASADAGTPGLCH